MSESKDSVDVDKLGQAAYTGQVAVVSEALADNARLAHVADTVLFQSFRFVVNRKSFELP